jgi:drug/metabolite transporter (DMT)-like permease
MVVVTLMWSTAGVVTRQLEFARSFEVTFWRSFFTALSLLVMLPLWQGRAIFARLHSSPPALWVSGLCWSVMFTAFMVALTLTSVANVLVTMSLGPLLTAIAAWVYLGHPVPRRTWLAIAVAGAGVVFMYASQWTTQGMAGSLVALCVPVAGAVNWTVNQAVRRHGGNIDLVPAVLVGAILSALLTLPFALPLQASVHDLKLLALLGTFQLAIPCVLSVICARVLAAPEVSLLALLEVIFGIFLAWIGAGEAPTLAVMVGGAMVIGALVVNEIQGWRQRT